MISMDSADLVALSKRFNNHKHSYFLLGSLHGYSISELKIIMQSQTGCQYLNAEKQPDVLLSVFDVDQSQEHARIQLYAIKRVEIDLTGFMQELKSLYQLKRLYSYVFPEEEIEISCLESAGFLYEAVFRQHVYVDGRYRDLLVYGQSENVI